MMYEELVEKLRDDNACLSISVLHEAADVIEKLSSYARQFEDLRKDGYCLQKTKMMTYGQATMTMPLPQPPKEES